MSASQRSWEERRRAVFVQGLRGTASSGWSAQCGSPSLGTCAPSGSPTASFYIEAFSSRRPDATTALFHGFLHTPFHARLHALIHALTRPRRNREEGSADYCDAESA